MKISYNSLKTLINFDYSPVELGEKLTATGLEVEAIEEVESIKGGLKGLVIGQVITCEKHPDADKLNITTVSVGQSDLLNIVCGAPNVAVGQKVVVALVGTTLYPLSGEPFTIKKSKIRGAVSEGMLCAEDEIGLGESHAGIIVLETNLPLGTPIAEYYQLHSDYIIEIGLTPNRSDAASHLGVARDIQATGHKKITFPDISNFKLGDKDPSIILEVQNSKDCPRFCGLEIKNVTVKPSPEWLKNFLKSIGVNSINNLVDISNYVCHYLGQPMHIFDADQILGNKVVVKNPNAGTKFKTLDGIERIFNGEQLAICNHEAPMAIAGVFGGEISGVTENTKNIFIEVAYFNPTSIRKTANAHGLKTDASFRYERGTDPNMPPLAIKFAANLILQLAGGEIANQILESYPEKINNFDINVKFKNIDRLIGQKLPKETIYEILEKLEITVLEKSEEAFKVSVPPYRVDVNREADIIEEILRIYGFDNIPLSENLSSEFIANFPTKEQESQRVRLSESLMNIGFNEIQTLSIVKPTDNEGFNQEEVVKLLNPLSEEISEMRTSLLFSGLHAIAYNINRKNKDLKLFEFGRTYSKQTKENQTKIKEKKILGIWITGNTQFESWVQKSKQSNFYDLNQVVIALLDLFRVNEFESNPVTDTNYAYGLSYFSRNKELIKLGKVQSKILKKADIKQEVYYAEIDWDLLLKVYNPNVKFIEIPKYPAARRDLSLVIEKNVTFEQIKKLANQTEKNLLKEINIFDVYEGDKLKENEKSYSVSFTLLDTEKTLNEGQIEKTMQKLMLTFEQKLGAIIRK